MRQMDLRRAIVEISYFCSSAQSESPDRPCDRCGGACAMETSSTWDNSPDQFIPLVEQMDLIMVCPSERSIQRYASVPHGIRTISTLKCLSTSQHGICSLASSQVKLLDLAATGLSPSQLELEITESAIMADPERTMETVTRIRNIRLPFFY